MTEDLEAKSTPYRVLVVEDDAIIGLGLVSYLQELGAAVDWSTTVNAALGVIKSGAVVDLAIVDLNLDGTLSTPVIEQLFEKKIRTVLCTGYDVTGAYHGCGDIPRLQKPFTRRKVRDLLAGHL